LPAIGTLAAMVASIGCLGLALKSLPVGTAHAVWTGIGATGTAALGEPATLLRLACIGLILSGIIGLKITSYVRRDMDLAEGQRSKIAL
jgi:quaternary ammonium compound-resistance protein SugE